MRLINMPRYADGHDRRELRFVDVPHSDEHESHPGDCCVSCSQDDEDVDGCCCRVLFVWLRP